MKKIVDELVHRTNFNNQPSDIYHGLLSFQKSVGEFSYLYSDQSLLLEYFTLIWEVLLKCSTHKDSTVRLSSYATTTSFLIKTVPFHPHLLLQSFSNISNSSELEMDGSVVLIASFAFLSNFIAAPSLSNFLDLTPIFHHFVVSDAISSEYLCNVISNLGNLPINWFETLLAAFVTQAIQSPSPKPSRHTMKAISTLIFRKPIELMDDVMNNTTILKKWTPKRVSLVSFILGSIPSSFSEIDFTDGADYAMSILAHSNEADSMMFVDDALILLCYPTTSIKLSVTTLSENKLTLTLSHPKNSSKEDISIEFDYSNLKQRPTLYMLPLPREMLIPSKEDSSAVICSKFKTLIRSLDPQCPCDVEEFIDLVDSFCGFTYDNTVSSCLQILESCVNILALNAKSYKLARVLRRVLFAPPVSWFHAMDLLRIFSAINLELVPILFGPSGFEEMLRTLINFSMNPNETLSKAAFNAVCSLTDINNYETVTKTLTNVDFFDSQSLQNHLKLLAVILKQIKTRYGNKINQKHPHLRGFVLTIFEILDQYTSDLDTLSSIFLFLAQIDLSQFRIFLIQPVFSCAIRVTRAGLNQLTGVDQSPEFHVTSHFDDLVARFLQSRSIEIVEEGAPDFRRYFQPVYAAAIFLLSLSVGVVVTTSCAMSVTLNLFKFFPDEVSQFLEKSINAFDLDQRLKALQNLSGFLENVSSVRVHGIWANLLTEDWAIQNKSHLQKIHEVVEETSKFYLMKSNELSLQDFISFVHYLNQFSPNYDEIISSAYSNQSPSRLIELSSLDYDLFMKFSPLKNIFIPKSEIEAIKSFDRLHEVQKTILINSLVSHPPGTFVVSSPSDSDLSGILNGRSNSSSLSQFSNEELNNVVQYGKSILIGWKLIRFLTNFAQEVELPEPRVFNPIYIGKNSKLLTFSKEELQAKLQMFVDEDYSDGIKRILRYAEIQGLELDFSHLDISPSTMTAVLRFLKKTQKQQLIAVASRLTHEELCTPYREATILAMEIIPDPFIDYYLKAEHIKKTELFALSRAIPQLSMDKQGPLSSIVISQLKNANSKRRYATLFKLATVILQKYKDNKTNVLDEISSSLLSASKTAGQNLPIHIAARCFELLTPLDTSFIEFIKTISDSSACFLKCYIQSGYGYPNIPKGSISLFFSGERYPISHIANGLRILSSAVTSENLQLGHSIINAILKSALDSIVANINYPVISELGCNLCCEILDQEGYEEFIPLVQNYFTLLWVPPSNPIFTTMNPLLPVMIRRTDSNSELFNDLCKCTDDLVVSDTRYSIFRVFSYSLEERLSRFFDSRTREQALLDALLSWLDKHRGKDGYLIEKYLWEWTRLMREYLDMQQMLNVICFQFLRTFPRFFPTFYILAKTVTEILSFAAKRDRPIIQKALEDATQLIEKEKHKLALNLLLENDKSKLREAIDLAREE